MFSSNLTEATGTCGFGIFWEGSSAHRYRDIEKVLSHATLAQGAFAFMLLARLNNS